MLKSVNTTESLNTTVIVDCLHFPVTTWMLTTFTTINIFFLLPLYILVIVLGCQRRWKQEFAFTASSHSDVFTYNMIAMEVVQVQACVCLCIFKYLDLPLIMMQTLSMLFKTFCVKILFHMLTCIELFTAVVYPVTYLRLKNSLGVKIRNVAIGCVWLLCFFWVMSGFQKHIQAMQVFYFSLIALVLSVVSFCCISVLCTLKSPGPGHHIGVHERVDQSKLRAFYNIATIMAVLWLSLGGVLVFDALEASMALHGHAGCVPALCAGFLSLPGSLVLPILFLQRAGKLQLGKN